MKIALFTSEKLKDEAIKTIKGVKDVEIFTIDVDVAAFMKSMDVINLINKSNKNFDFIILPGNFIGNTNVIEERIKEKTCVIKGTKNLYDVKILIENLKNLTDKEIEQLHFNSADKILKKFIEEKLNDELKFMDNEGIKKFEIKGINCSVTLNGIPKVVAEICDAPLMSDEELKERAKYFINEGARIIDIGMLPEPKIDEVKRIIKAIREVTDVPISIDTLNKDEILEGVKYGAGMVMSIDETNFEIVENLDVPVVVIPRDKNGIKKHDERIKFIENLIEKIKKRNEGIKIIVDLILDPLNFGFSKSLYIYEKFREKYKEMPMLMGVGNVTELFDVDSHGVNALLASIAYELNIDLIFTPEYSPKCKNSVKELNTAINMMYLTKKRNQPPKDIGIDLLILKDKQKIVNEKINCDFVFPEKIVPKLDKINFQIVVKDRIYVMMRESRNPDAKPKFCIKGENAEEIYLTIIKYLKDNNIEISKEHCAYLGKELSKAEIALKLGKNYVQDDELFKNF